MGGVFKFIDEEALILTDIAESGDEIDEVRAKEALARAQARLKDADASIDAKRAEAAKERAEQRLANKGPEIDVDRATIALKKAICRLNALN